jgi:hypothetical protein
LNQVMLFQGYKKMTNMATLYKIRVKGHLNSRWAEWFSPLVIQNEAGGEATLTGPIHDQAELHSLLIKVRDLSLPLLSLSMCGE